MAKTIKSTDVRVIYSNNTIIITKKFSKKIGNDTTFSSTKNQRTRGVKT